MKIRVTMKDPDSLSDAIAEAASAEIAGISNDADEREAVAELRRKKAGEVCAKWFEYDEYLTVEIDTETGTCIVQPVSH